MGEVEVTPEVTIPEITPDLNAWTPNQDQIFMIYDTTEVVVGLYDKWFGITGENGEVLSKYKIGMNHYKKKMPDIVHHINYFESYYDTDHELFVSTMSVKFLVDMRPDMKQRAFRNLVLDRIITPSFVTKIKAMAKRLYTLNIDTDQDGKYRNTPKITNDQARQIVALSFCFRMILPLAIHFANKSPSFVNKKDYIQCLDKLFTAIIRIFEKDDIKVYTDLCRFIEYRINKAYNFDKRVWIQKKQLHGLTKDIFTEEVIHEVIIVKSLHKLSYNLSCVSFFDGIFFGYNMNFKKENYPAKPFEIDSDENSNDSDDYLSHAEALEMSTYRLDESNLVINAANTRSVLNELDRIYNIPVTEEEAKFYMKHCKLNEITEFLLHSFYSSIFHDSYAIYNISRKETIRLLIIMKKYLQLRGMILLPQICTAQVSQRYKDNAIRNAKFVEGITSTDMWINVIAPKYKYIDELTKQPGFDSKGDPKLQMLCAIINSVFIFVDPNPKINRKVFDNLNLDQMKVEFSMFLGMI